MGQHVSFQLFFFFRALMHDYYIVAWRMKFDQRRDVNVEFSILTA